MRRTVDDWLKHAGDAGDAAEVARCLDGEPVHFRVVLSAEGNPTP